jgi:hypothetical protein|eukprot:COSAG01_NODE_4332_length_5128_cov_4.066017_2_plen_386_part_00
MQAPDDLGLAPAKQQQAGTGLIEQRERMEVKSKASRLLVEHDRASLRAFLGQVLPVVERMLPAAGLRIAAPFTSEAVRSENSLSVCYSTLPSPPRGGGGAGRALAARDVCYHRRTGPGSSASDHDEVAVAYGPADGWEGAKGAQDAADDDDESGLVCVWEHSARESSEPREMLRCAGAVNCCWVGTLGGSLAAGASVVVAGTQEGSVAVWDLGQARSAVGLAGTATGVRERWPTYCTDAHREAGANHAAPVVCVRPCPNADDSELAQALAMSLEGSTDHQNSFALGGQDGDGSDSSARQIATMDTQGTVIIWSLISLGDDYVQEMVSSGDIDLGLGLGGRCAHLYLSGGSGDCEVSSAQHVCVTAVCRWVQPAGSRRCASLRFHR